MPGFAVVIPTRERAPKLGRCLAALSAAQEHGAFPVYVGDSSRTSETRAEVAAVCAEHPFVLLRHHDGRNVAAARNFCAAIAEQPLLLNIDDDIYVEPEAVHRLAAAYRAASGPRVVAGSVAWDQEFSRPVRLRLNGWGRYAREGESPHFLVGAFFAYPRALALALPWNERLRVSDDRFVGALWRSKGIRLLWEPGARAFHDHQHVSYGVEDQWSHFYTNLFDTVLANRHPGRAFAYETLGFVAGLRGFARSRRQARQYVRGFVEGHRALARDRDYLRDLLHREVPTSTWDVP